MPLLFRVFHVAPALAVAFALGFALSMPRPVLAAAPDKEPAAVVPPELSEDARKGYSQGLREARELMAGKEYSAALIRIDALLATRPREPQARFLKGVAQTEQGQDAAAIATFRGLVEDYPELPEPYNNLAVIYAQSGDYENARSALETAVRAAPDWSVAHENLGDVYVRLAAVQYDRAATLNKGNKTAAAKLVLAREFLAPK